MKENLVQEVGNRNNSLLSPPKERRDSLIIFWAVVWKGRARDECMRELEMKGKLLLWRSREMCIQEKEFGLRFCQHSELEQAE